MLTACGYSSKTGGFAPCTMGSTYLGHPGVKLRVPGPSQLSLASPAREASEDWTSS